MSEKTKFAVRIVLVEFTEGDLKNFSLYDKTEACLGKTDLIKTKTRMYKEVDNLIETKVRDEN